MDEDAVDRVRHQILAIIKSNSEDPESVARETWLANVFEDHPYGRPEKGTEATLGALTPEDLKGYVKDNFARSNLKIAVVGDITAEQLAPALDGIFGDLPENPKLAEVPEAKWQIDGSQLVVPMATPQTVVTFGFPGPKRNDPDFYAAYILNNIVGGGGFSSRLMEEVREKRGLAYSAYTYLNPLDHAGISMGGVATKNERVRESIEVIKSVFEDIAKNGPTEQELEDAKRYLTGSYALRFSSSTQIASIVLWVQLENLGMDYIEKRNGLIESVQLEDIKRAASLIDLKDMFITIVGQPDGIEMLGKPAASNFPPRG
jgi:zinc protease